MDKSKKGSAEAVAPPAPQPTDRIKVRVLCETYGTPRAPIGRRGDLIEITRKEFDAAPGSFEDLAAAAKAALPEPPPADPWVEQMRESLRAEREASAQARAISAAREAERVNQAAEHFAKLAKGQ